MSGITATTGSFQITSDVANWNRRTTPGHSIMIAGAGVDSGTLVSKIDRVFNSGSASMVDVASTTVAAAAFKHGRDEFTSFQAHLGRIASTIEAPDSRVIKLQPGTTVVDLSNETASLFIQGDTRIKGWGEEGSQIEVFGTDHATLFRTSGSNVRVILENVKINMNSAFFSGSLGTTAILIENGKFGKLENVSVIGASGDAICISGSSGIVLQNIDTTDVGNAVRVADSDNIMLTNLTDSGSAGTGLLLENVESSSFTGLAMDEQGSGSFTQDEASSRGGNLVAGFQNFINVQAPGINSPTGSWIQFIEGGPKQPGFGTAQGALFANYSGAIDDNWIGLVGGVDIATSDLTEVADLTPYFSISLATGRVGFSGSSFTIEQEIIALGGVSGSNFSGSFTGSFAGDGSGLLDVVSASHALRSVTASHALNAEGLENLRTGSYTGSLIGNLTGTHTGTLDGTASFADFAGEVLGGGTGSFTGSFTGDLDLTENQEIPVGVQVFHALQDLGIQSSSFTASFDNGNVQRFEAGGDVTISLSDAVPGGIYVMGIDNTGDHGYRFESASTGVLWHNGIVPFPSDGSDVLGFMQFEQVMVGYVIAQDVFDESGTPNFEGLFTGSFTGSMAGEVTGTVSGALESKKVAYVIGPFLNVPINVVSDITYDVTVFMDTANFSGSTQTDSNQIGIVKDGNYRLTVHATTVQTSSNQPTSQVVRLQENVGAGFVTIPNGRLKSNINDQGDDVSSVSRTVLRTLVSGTLIKAEAEKLTGTGDNSIESGSFGLIIEEL